MTTDQIVPLKAGDVLPTGVIYTGPPSHIAVREYAETPYSPPGIPRELDLVSRFALAGVAVPTFALPFFSAHPIGWAALAAIASGAAIAQIPEVRGFFADVKNFFIEAADLAGQAAIDSAELLVHEREVAQAKETTEATKEAWRRELEAYERRAASLRQEKAAITQMQQFMAEQAVSAAGKADEIVATALTREELTYRLSTMLSSHFITAEVIGQITSMSVATWDIARSARTAEAEAVAAGALGGIRAIDPEAAADMEKMGLGTLAAPLTMGGMMAAQMVMSKTLARQQHRQGLGCMATTGGMLASNIMGAALPMGLAAGLTFSPQLQQFASNMVENMVTTLYGSLIDRAPIRPEDAFAVGSTLLAQAVGFGAAAHLVSVTAEASAPLKHMGLGYLSAFLADMAGFSKIAGALQGMMITWGLAQPMRYWALDKFRPMILEARDIFQLMSRRAFTEPETLRVEGLAEAVTDLPGGGGPATEQALIGYLGYPANYYPLFKELANTPLRYFPLAGIARSGFFDRAWYEEALARSGYSVTAKEQLIKMYEWQVLEATQGMMSGAVTKPYRLGLIDDDQFDIHLSSLGYQPRQIEKALYAAKLDFATEQAEDTKKLYIEQFKKGLIDDTDLAVAVSSLGYRPEAVDIEVQRAITAVTPKVAKEKPPDTKAATRALQSKYTQLYRELYRKYYIDERQFLSNLLAIEIDPELAKVTVALEEAKRLPKPEVLSP